MYCSVSPFGSVEVLGVTPIDTRVAGVTVSGVEPETVPSNAVMVVDPCAAAVATPFEPLALLTLAMLVADELQLTAEVRFCVVLSVYVPVAVNC